MLSGSEFDPCRQWLGIDAVDLVKPHCVLGLPAWETDPAKIVTAADKRLKQLRGVDPGSMTRARDGLIRRVEEARNAMLAGLSGADVAGDSAVGAEGSGIRSAAARHAASAAPEPFPGELPAAYRVPTPPAVPPVVASPPLPAAGVQGMDDPADEPTLEGLRSAPPPWPVQRRVVYRRRSDNSSAWLAVVALVAVLGLGVLLLSGKVSSPAAAKREVAANKPSAVHTPESPRDKQTRPVAHPPDLRPVPEPHKPPEHTAREHRPPAPKPEPPKPAPPRPMETRPEAPAPMPDLPKPERPQPDRPKPPKPPETMRSEELSPEGDDAELEANRESSQRLIRQAFTALRHGKFDVVERSLEKAEDISQNDDDTVARVNLWRQLLEYARDYPGYRDRALAAMATGGEVEVGSDTISVVEVGPNHVVYREKGQTKRAGRDQLPSRIEQAIVRKWFAADGRAANHLYLGAAAVSRDPPDLQTARKDWEAADRGGSRDGRALLKLLDDPVVSAKLR